MKKIFFLGLLLLILLSGCTQPSQNSSDTAAQQAKDSLDAGKDSSEGLQLPGEPVSMAKGKLLSDNLELLSFDTETKTVEIKNEKLKQLLEDLEETKKKIGEIEDIDLPEDGEEQFYYNLDLKFSAEVVNEGEAGDITLTAILGTFPSTEETVYVYNNQGFTEFEQASQTVYFEKGETKTIEVMMDTSIPEDWLLTGLIEKHFDTTSILDVLYYQIDLNP